MLLAAGSLIAVLVGSTGLRVAGFAVGALAIVFLVADQLTARVGYRLKRARKVGGAGDAAR